MSSGKVELNCLLNELVNLLLVTVWGWHLWVEIRFHIVLASNLGAQSICR